MSGSGLTMALNCSVPLPIGRRAMPISMPATNALSSPRRPRLVVVDQVEQAMGHQRPVAAHQVEAAMFAGIGLPGGARRLAGHRIVAEGARHGMPFRHVMSHGRMIHLGMVHVLMIHGLRRLFGHWLGLRVGAGMGIGISCPAC